MLKKCKIIMLESKDDSPTSVPFVRMPQKNKLVIHAAGGEFRKYLSLGFKPQHLYILSDEEIKEGDWQINHLTNKISIRTNSPLEISVAHCSKIIATTDKSLKIEVSRGFIGKEYQLPEPSKSFIDVFMREHNKDNIITEVMVEYYWEPFSGIAQLPAKLKISKDNTITIKKVKDSWTREEVVTLLKEALKQSKEQYSKLDSIGEDKWIEENL